MGRVSREQAAENRAKVVVAASTLFRRHGMNGVGIDDLMAEAGLTHGGFYGQFGSKDVLAGEACTHAFDAVERAWNVAGKGDAAGRLQRLADFYFAPKPPGADCPMATLAGDAAHAPAGSPLRRAFTTGLQRLARLIAGRAAAGNGHALHGDCAERDDNGMELDDRALAVLAAMVGAAVLRRAGNDKALATSIESAVKRLAAASAIPAG